MAYRYKVHDGITKIKTKLSITLSIIGLMLGSSAMSLFAFSTAHASGAGKVLYAGNCGTPSYSTVQDAVNAAKPGDTVYLCGTFSEQVFISKSIILTGAPGSGLSASGTTFSSSSSDYPAAFTNDGLFLPQALIVTSGASTNVSIKGLNISGPMPGNGSCAEEEYGILALGGNVNLSNDNVASIADTNSALYGCQFGVGVQIGRVYWPTANFSSFKTENFSATASINNVSVSGYQKNGITVDGPDSSANIQNSTVTGAGPTSALGVIIAQNGIQISRGATGEVGGNTVTNNAYSGRGDASSGGILIYGGCGDPNSTHVNVHNNVLQNNDVGIYSVNYNADCNNAPATATDEDIHNNTISSSSVTNVSGYCDVNGCPGDGYQAGIDDVGNGDNIHNNDISGAGYQSAGTITNPSPVFVRPIDTISFPTIDPEVHNNNT